MNIVNKEDIPKSVMVRINHRILNKLGADRIDMGLSKAERWQEDEAINIFWKNNFVVTHNGQYFICKTELI